MKNLQKVLALGLVFVMLFSMAVVAFAVDGTNSITIYNDVAGHNYQAYQIFSGTLKDGKLYDIEWGSGVDSAKLTEGKLGGKTAAEWAKALEDGTAVAKDFAALVAANLAANPTASTNTHKDSVGTEQKKGYEMTGLDAGYYLVKDEFGHVPENGDGYTAYILKVVGNAEAKAKSGTPEVDKQVEDKNDSAKNSSAWDETADHDIGDDVPFRLVGTLPENYAEYKTYKYIFHDKMSSGLTLNAESIKVSVWTKAENGTIEYKGEKYNAVEIDLSTYAGAYTVENPTSDGCTFHVAFANLKAEDLAGLGITADSLIVVNYTATLNDGAVVGVPGNPNNVKLEFSNNPNWDGTGTPDNPGDEPEEPTDETPEDTVVVFTYELDVNKVDQNGNAVAKAKFTLSKKDENGNWQPVKFTEKNGKYYVDPNGTITEVTGETLSNFQFVGLDDGDYKLEETEAPEGYNKLAAPIYFTISAQQNNTDGSETLTSVDFTVTSGDATITGGTGVEGNGGTVGVGTTNVVNQKGSTLPSTGGIGTTIFYVIGGLMVLCAGVLLIAKRRMNAED